ncbi:MAG: hypothetical protein WD851_01955 [Pirellulales bacterium]
MNTNRFCILLGACVWGMSSAACTAQHVDVLLQLSAGKIVVGAANYDDGTWMIGQRVFSRQFLSNFRANDPGFTGLETGNALLEPGVMGFPSNRNVYFDLLPMWIDAEVSNLFFWDGADPGGDGLALADVSFVVPSSGITWNILDDGFNLFTADSSEEFVSGGLIQQTSSDTDPLDGIDTGTIHQHLLLRVDDGDGNTQTTPPEGVYMVALQARAEGFETSDPFLFVHRTFNVSNEVRDLAAQWAVAHYNSLFGPPVVPGDYNGDGDIDAADYSVWRDTLNSTTNLAADGDGSLQIGAGDYQVWRENFGNSFPIGAANVTTVPEPCNIALWIVAIIAVSHVVRRPSLAV